MPDYAPARDENTPADRRETCRVLEDTHVLPGPRTRDPRVEVRRILVHSTGNAKGQQRARDKRLAKAREELDKLQRGPVAATTTRPRRSPPASA